ncbi:tether containing UBX domainfor GLUT4 [Rhodotorula toruloides]|uniref:Tether containing UBX domainfor GLUT4 n=1 Tax=Rhodotorula toruloides TaxID=5286 RepID=A0A511KN13_RHOTO|nr:tether containing UBX domainfor GLUT4 [Rhodotorula toruloides]
MTSRLPGDAHSSPFPSPSPEPVAGPSTTPAPVQPAAGPARTVILTSVSPVDPLKRREFEARFYLPFSTHATATTRFLDLPESYFQPTQVELQQAFAGQIKKREDLTDRPLMTKALREREDAAKNRAKAARWPHTRIRIRFPDRSQLEGVFPSTDKLVHLYEFVRLALREDVRDIPFVLYQTPPRTEYRCADSAYKGKNLMDLQFTPSTALYIKFEATPPGSSAPALRSGITIDDLNSTTSSPPPLTLDLLAAAGELPLPPSFLPGDETPADAPSGESEEARKKREKEEKMKRLLGKGLGMGGSKGSVKPSWFKMGKDAHK